jgi:hypothetical protein
MACNRGARVAECLGEKKEKAKAAKKKTKKQCGDCINL